MALWLPDLSHHQGRADVAQLQAAGAAGLILKASEGAVSTDRSFPCTASGARARRMLLGAYHFAQPGQSSGESQAMRLAQLCDAEGATLAVLDIEVGGGLGRADLRAWCADFLGTLRAHHPGAIAAYCSQSYASSLGDVLFAGGVGRWIASPGCPPAVPFDLWQSSWRGRLPSISGPVDINTWTGDEASLSNWFTGVGHPPPPGGAAEIPTMLVTYENAVYSWNAGGAVSSVLRHTNPQRVHDLEAYGIRHIQPTDPSYPLYEPLIETILASVPATLAPV